LSQEERRGDTIKRAVLITGIDGGAAQSVVKCLRKAGGYRIIVTGVDSLAIGLHLGDVGYLMPFDWGDYKKRLQKISLEEKVKIIIPGSDIELENFAKYKRWYEELLPPIIIDYQNIKYARDKYLLQAWLHGSGFPYIKTWLEKDLDKVDTLVALKPRAGFGSNMLFQQVRPEWAKMIGQYIKDRGWEPIAQEWLYGDEYSCMTLRTKEGELLGTMVAWSVKKYGQSFKTKMVIDSEIEKLVNKVSEKLNSIGPLSVQLMRTPEGELKIFELNARFTGAQIVRAEAGFNMPDAAIRNWLDGEKIYGKVNKPLIAYWYHDFGYSKPETLDKLTREGKIKKGKVNCPKYL